MEWLKHLAIRKEDGILVNNWYQGKVYCKASPIHLLDENNYFDNKLHGIQYSWYFNGTLRYKDNYAHGEKHGIQLNYNAQGVIVHKEDYNHGLKHGLQYSYKTRGEPYITCQYNYGKFVKTWI